MAMSPGSSHAIALPLPPALLRNALSLEICMQPGYILMTQETAQKCTTTEQGDETGDDTVQHLGNVCLKLLPAAIPKGYTLKGHALWGRAFAAFHSLPKER